MTSDARFERLLADVLAEVAPSREPDRLVPEILRAARRVHRWPRWLALIKEPPMRVSSRVGVGSPTFRLVSVMAITLALLLAVGAAVVAGASLLPSPAPHVLPPYGPAANGAIIYEVGGDIYVADATGDNARPIVAGPERDAYPWFSHDGTKIAFGRGTDADLALMVANADGSDVHEVMRAIQSADFMPSDSQLVATRTIDGQLVISIVDVDGGNLHDLDIGDLRLAAGPGGVISPLGWVEPRPTDGQELVFTANPDKSSIDRGFYAIRPDGTGLRQIGDIRTGESQVAPYQVSMQDPVLSPDGKTVAYWSWEARAGGSPDTYLHVRDLDTGHDRQLDLYPFSDRGYGPHFSPDSRSLIFESHSATTPGDVQLVIAPADGSQPATPIGPSYKEERAFDFSPDGTKVFLTLSSPPGTTIIDLATGDFALTKQAIPTVPNWQRLAP